MSDPFELYNEYLKNNNIKKSKPRESVLEIFLNTEKHLTIYELYELVRKKFSYIGQATVYRAMKVICSSGLAEEVDIGDGTKRFEHKYGHDHHDHLICIKCGRILEVTNNDIEALQEKMCSNYNFMITSHKLQIFGYCEKCR